MEALAGDSATLIEVDNDVDADYTAISVLCSNKRGLLGSITSLFRDLGLDVRRAEVGNKDVSVPDKFYVVDESTGQKLNNASDVANVKKCLETLFQSRASGKPSRPDFGKKGVDTLYTLMGKWIRSVCGGEILV